MFLKLLILMRDFHFLLQFSSSCKYTLHITCKNLLALVDKFGGYDFVLSKLIKKEDLFGM